MQQYSAVNHMSSKSHHHYYFIVYIHPNNMLSRAKLEISIRINHICWKKAVNDFQNISFQESFGNVLVYIVSSLPNNLNFGSASSPTWYKNNYHSILVTSNSGNYHVIYKPVPLAYP